MTRTFISNMKAKAQGFCSQLVRVTYRTVPKGGAGFNMTISGLSKAAWQWNDLYLVRDWMITLCRLDCPDKNSIWSKIVIPSPCAMDYYKIVDGAMSECRRHSHPHLGQAPNRRLKKITL